MELVTIEIWFDAADRMDQWAIKIWNWVLVNARCDLFDFDLNITN